MTSSPNEEEKQVRAALFENLVKVIDDSKVTHEDVAHVLCNILGNIVSQAGDRIRLAGALTYLIAEYALHTSRDIPKDQT